MKAVYFQALLGAVLLNLVCPNNTTSNLTEVLHISGVPDYRFVTLSWEYPRPAPSLYAFHINYCELQAWGPNRCKTKIVDNIGSDDLIGPGRHFKSYSVVIQGLRMATNYSFHVRPLDSKKSSSTKGLGKKIIVSTMGFSAKASLCLPDSSEVEVSTGPYFGGRIAVEGPDGAPLQSDECSVGGDPTSPRDSYILRIDHKLCASQVNRTAVQTYILVQENLPILTHSTRRFLVLCTFQPETLTVRAGINLPSQQSQQHQQHGQSSVYTEDSENDIQASPLLRQQHVSHRYEHAESEAHMVLMAIFVISGIVGVGLVAWWFSPYGSSYADETGSVTPSSSIFSDDCSVFDNYTNSLRDTVSLTDIDFGVAALEQDVAGSCSHSGSNCSQVGGTSSHMGSNYNTLVGSSSYREGSRMHQETGACNRILQERLSGRTIVVDVPYAHSEA
uniref:Fibronectin type-III domain-containing protein n=1 Tax=Cacopsylla melanoneura TaxID=428564 RepID=A0A8D8Z213_9HEMI